MRAVIDKIFERLFVAILALAILPCIVSIVVHALGPILLTVGIVAVIAGVYRSLDRARPGTKLVIARVANGRRSFREVTGDALDFRPIVRGPP